MKPAREPRIRDRKPIADILVGACRRIIKKGIRRGLMHGLLPDRDGKLDMVTANYRDRSMSLLKGKGDGSFEPAVTTPKGLRLVDGKWVPE